MHHDCLKCAEWGFYEMCLLCFCSFMELGWYRSTAGVACEWLQSETYAAGIRQAVATGIDKWQVTMGYLDSNHKPGLNYIIYYVYFMNNIILL